VGFPVRGRIVRLQDFGALLRSVVANTSHCESDREACPKIVYIETGRQYARYDNVVFEAAWLVDVHFYTNAEFDPLVEALEKGFNDNGVPFDMESVLYGREEDGRASKFKYLFKCVV